MAILDSDIVVGGLYRTKEDLKTGTSQELVVTEMTDGRVRYLCRSSNEAEWGFQGTKSNPPTIKTFANKCAKQIKVFSQSELDGIIQSV